MCSSRRLRKGDWEGARFSSKVGSLKGGSKERALVQ